MSTLPEKGLQIRTLIKPEGELELSLAEVEIPTPGPTDIIIKVEATPINPSDLGLLVARGISVRLYKAALRTVRSSPRKCPTPACAP